MDVRAHVFLPKPITSFSRVGIKRKIRAFEKGDFILRGFQRSSIGEFAKEEFLDEEEQGSSTGATLRGKGEDPLGVST